MTDAMKILLQYAEEHLVHPLMIQAPGYFHIRSNVETYEKAFLDLLTEETEAHFEKMMAERRELDSIYEQALFCAGFQIALELTR